MSTYFHNRIVTQYFEEAKSFRHRAGLNQAYVNLKMEYDKLAEATDNNKEPELYINSDLSALVVELSNTIANISKRNANLLTEIKELKNEVTYLDGKLRKDDDR